MSRRALPARATRGAKPVKTEEEQRKDNQIYAKMFGADLDDDEDFILRQAKQNQRKERTMRNLRKYSYARGYTYCFDLDSFPRLEGSPSYAVDHSNIFASTYHQEEKPIGPTKLGHILNRQYFGLPYTEHEQRGGEGSNTKNACHYYLFQNEDKKYHLDRTILTFKKILHLMGSGGKVKVKEFALVRRDPQLQEMLRSDAALQVKLEALGRKIQALQQRRAANISGWYYEDQLFLRHSLNQTLHIQVQKMKKKAHLSKIIELLYATEQQLNKAREENQTDASSFIKNALTFYNTNQMAITSQLINTLTSQYSKSILSLINNEPTVRFPLQVFYFGPPALQQAVNAILASKIQQENEINYYTAKFAWRKLFKSELPAHKHEKVKLQELIPVAKRLVEEAQYFYKQPFLAETPTPTLDHLFNAEQLQQQSTGSVSLFKEGQSVQVKGKDLMLICLYDWLCKAYALLLPFAQRNPELPLLIAAELFEKYSHGLVEATGNPLVGTLHSNLRLLCDVISRNELNAMDISLSFQFLGEMGVGVLWRRKVEEMWQTEREDEQQEEVIDSPTKKRKENE